MIIGKNEWYFRIFAVGIFLVGQSLFAVPNGYTGRTLLTSSAGCGSCHGNNASTGVQATITGPATVAAGQTATYTINVTVGTSTSTTAGVDIAVSAGTLAPVSPQLKLSGGEITHNTRLTRGTDYRFNYTAPASGGPVTMYATVAGNSSSWNWASNVIIALPVQLSSFNGTAISTTEIRLDWKTLSEVNNYGFFVERREPGEQTFVELAGSFVSGHGTTNVPHEYSYTDHTATSGTLYYRLKQVDLDGSSQYTDPIEIQSVTSVSGGTPRAFSLSQNYPNPFNPSTSIEFTLPEAAPVTLKVVDNLGREVATLVQENLSMGTYKTRWDASNLPSGTYYYRLQAGDAVATKKLVLVK
jgi:Secretion system C-terminal sorting domain